MGKSLPTTSPSPSKPDTRGATKRSRAEHSTKEKSLISSVENGLKIGAGGLGVVAAMGFPATYLQFSRFDIPPHFMSYEQILAAGVIPTMFLTAVSLYIFWAGKKLKEEIKEKKIKSILLFLLLPGFFILPLFVFSLVVLFIGAICYAILLMWGFMWGMTWIFSTVVDADISNRQILYGAIGLIVVSGLVVGIGHTLLWLFPNQQGRFWSELRDFLDFDERVKRKRPTPAPKRNNAATADSKRSDGESNSWWELLLISFIGMALVSGVLLYSVKGVLYIWDPDLSAILSHQRILLLGVASGLGYGSFMTGAACAEWASSESRSTRSRSFLVLASAVLILFIGSVSFYSYTIYPALPQGLGGGKPIPIDLWLNSEDFPDDLRKRLAKCSPDASGRRTVCRDVRLVHADSEYLILSEKDRPPSLTFIFPKDHIQVISF